MLIDEMTTRKKYKLEQVSHKVIEKRRRDRINSCLTELSQTVPAAFAKQTSGKLEKAEILEMTVDYLRAISSLGQKFDNGDWLNPLLYSELQRHYATGYGDCAREVLRYVTEVEGLHVTDTRCIRMMTYLQTKGCPELIEGSAAVQAGGGSTTPPKASSPPPTSIGNRSESPPRNSHASTCVGSPSPAAVMPLATTAYPLFGSCFSYADFQTCVSETQHRAAFNSRLSNGHSCLGCTSAASGNHHRHSPSPMAQSSNVATDFLNLQFAKPPPPTFNYAAEFLPYSTFHSKH